MSKYSNFSFSKFNSVNIINCNFEEAVFQQVKLDKTTFNDTNLINTFFNKTILNKIDFTTCEIEGISVEISDIRGAIVTPIQGLDLTRLIGLVIQ